MYEVSIKSHFAHQEAIPFHAGMKRITFRHLYQVI